MVFSELDLKILKKFHDCASEDIEFTSWTLMKKIFPDGRDTQHTKVRRKLLNLVKMGLLHYSKKEGFVLIKDFIKINEIPILKNCISVQVDKKWEIFEL